jgi:hypothetical protein
VLPARCLQPRALNTLEDCATCWGTKLNALTTTCISDAGPTTAVSVGRTRRCRVTQKVTITDAGSWLLHQFEACANVSINFCAKSSTTGEGFTCAAWADCPGTNHGKLETGSDQRRRVGQFCSGCNDCSPGCWTGELLTQIDRCHRDLLWINHEHHLATSASSIAEPNPTHEWINHTVVLPKKCVNCTYTHRNEMTFEPDSPEFVHPSSFSSPLRLRMFL